MEINKNQLDNIQEYYCIISQARELDVINKSRSISDKTRSNYRCVAERLIFIDKKLPINCAQSKSTYYAYKAAVVSYILDAISKSVLNIDSLEKSNLAGWGAEVNNLKQYIDVLSIVGVDQEKQNLVAYRNGCFQSQWACKDQLSSRIKTKKSKARRLKTLPKDWAQRLFNYALQTNSKHIMAIAVMAISGCRPQELAYGVKLSLNEDESIHVYIHGAKTHQGLYGQMFRSFDIKDDSIEFGYLREQLQSHGVHLIVTADPGAVCDKITYLSRKAIARLKEPATAYCYRHRFSGTLHHAGLDAESIARALGHCTDQSQQYYSSAYRSGATGFIIRNIQSAGPIKLKNHARATKQSSRNLH